jgi:hypothetical protein
MLIEFNIEQAFAYGALSESIAIGLRAAEFAASMK